MLIETATHREYANMVAFLGVEKHGIVAVSTYGCIKSPEEKQAFKNGLQAMLETLKPKVVIVYGAMPESVFGDYRHLARFVQFDNWTKQRHGGR